MFSLFCCVFWGDYVGGDRGVGESGEWVCWWGWLFARVGVGAVVMLCVGESGCVGENG